ncbi:MAG: lipopolysaccharide transport system ATP-binding protein [Thermoleophilaceae bacterium]|nr:lipopolysaccharide transport system ATP-binding protein [Thermoleophilaceae bacterium]
MASDIAVTAQGVSKRYELGQLHGGYNLLSEAIADRFRRGARRERGPRREEFWALRDIGFEVARGETFGIVGHNGAGKSTLLKILSRVTPPTTGEIVLRGRVGALLEVGTGFHGELTGRENVYLNGAILGMKRDEIERKFDEIVEFAEVEQFIDTPVKRYSSGMYLRLAFSVAAHLEPEILIVDEVLSVGDLAFQEKCVNRMESVAGEGRTVLFVSHNLSAVQKLCPRSLLLSHGEAVQLGPTSEVIDTYVHHVRRDMSSDLAVRRDREGSGRLRFTEIWFESEGRRIDAPQTGRDCDIVIAYETADGKTIRDPSFAVSISTFLGVTLLHLHTQTSGTRLIEAPPRGEVRCHLPRCPLPAGQYSLNLFADRSGEILDWVQRAAEMTVTEGDFFGSGQTQPQSHQSILVDHTWSITPADVVAEPVP